MKALQRRYGKARLPRGQSTYTIKISGGRYAGEYGGASTVAATVRKAREEFLPSVDRNATVQVVHFDREGLRTIWDADVQSPPIGGYL